MKEIQRVTISFDEETWQLFKKIKEETKLSQSEIIRRTLRFYARNRNIAEEGDIGKKIKTYIEMLSGGEHVILDTDHWALFLKYLEGSRNNEGFWEAHRKIARSHADQLSKRIRSEEDLLKRLEICNFYKLAKTSGGEYALVLGSDVSKDFVKIFLEEVLSGMGYEVEIKEDFSKLRVKVSRWGITGFNDIWLMVRR